MKPAFYTLLLPTCFICNKLVDKLEWEQDYKSDQTIAIVYCHGEKEICALDNTFKTMNKIERGVAFYPSPKKLMKGMGEI